MLCNTIGLATDGALKLAGFFFAKLYIMREVKVFQIFSPSTILFAFLLLLLF